ncbi:hypothetical protein [Dokdonia sp. Asnod2-E02]|uniref:hypothetical protein n=1 Tax=Dokdonia sp. Asnod2-E02 TaxID=3160574 RepID=UPI00387035C2
MKLKALILLTFGTITISFGQEFAQIKSELEKRIPNDSLIIADGSWYYYPERGEIQKIIKPKVNKILPYYEFYKVHLTNYLGYHINRSNCLILLNTANSNSLLIEPIWFSGINKNFLKILIGANFETKEAFLSFLIELQELLLIGSGNKINRSFENTEFSDDEVTFELVENYSDRKVLRKIVVKIKNLTIKRFKILKPVLKN